MDDETLSLFPELVPQPTPVPASRPVWTPKPEPARSVATHCINCPDRLQQLDNYWSHRHNGWLCARCRVLLHPPRRAVGLDDFEFDDPDA